MTLGGLTIVACLGHKRLDGIGGEVVGVTCKVVVVCGKAVYERAVVVVRALDHRWQMEYAEGQLRVSGPLVDAVLIGYAVELLWR